MQPPLKWAGGKRWLLPQLRVLWEDFADRRYVEPFSGGLAGAFGLRPRRALLNDVNAPLINFYRWVKKGLVTSIPMKNEAQMFKEHRDAFNLEASNGGARTKRSAELFYYLNRTAYNGLYRTSRKTGFNVPFGKHGNITYVRDFTAYKPVMAEWELRVGDFAQVPIRKGDFVYADPPYDEGYTLYSRNGFSWDDQVRLVEWLNDHSGPVVISNRATERIIKLYVEAGFEPHYLDAPRRISCNGDRRRVREIVATKGLKWGTVKKLTSPRLEDV
jgi:DNA adenine methylase